MKATQGDRAVVFTSEHDDSIRVRAWDNGGVLTLDITYDDIAAVAIEVNGKEIVSF